MAVKNWAWQMTHPGEPLPAEVPYANQQLLIESVKESLEAGKKQSDTSPKMLVIGAVSLVSEAGRQLLLIMILAWTLWEGSRAIGQGCWHS